MTEIGCFVGALSLVTGLLVIAVVVLLQNGREVDFQKSKVADLRTALQSYEDSMKQDRQLIDSRARMIEDLEKDLSDAREQIRLYEEMIAAWESARMFAERNKVKPIPDDISFQDFMTGLKKI